MKGLIAVLFAAAPAAAQPVGTFAGMGGGWQPYSQGHKVLGAFALVAALGYWLLQHASKETAAYVKRTGTALGMTLAIVGLLGVFGTIATHIKRLAPSCGMNQGTALTNPVPLPPLPPAAPAKTK